MGKIFIEHRSIHAGTSLSWDLARHMCTRQVRGTMIVYSEKPVSTLAAVRKQWAKLIYQLQCERARRLHSPMAESLSQKLTYMQALRFTAYALEDTNADIYFCASEELTIPADCHTLYIAGCVPTAHLPAIIASLPKHALIVVYGNDLQPLLVAAANQSVKRKVSASRVVPGRT